MSEAILKGQNSTDSVRYINTNEQTPEGFEELRANDFLNRLDETTKLAIKKVKRDNFPEKARTIDQLKAVQK